MIERQITVTITHQGPICLSDLDQACKELHHEADMTGADPKVSWLQLHHGDGQIQGQQPELTVRMTW